MLKVFGECLIGAGHIQIELFQKANILRSVAADSIVLALQITCRIVNDRVPEFTNGSTEAFKTITAQMAEQ